MKATKTKNARSLLPDHADSIKAAASILAEHGVEVTVEQLRRIKAAGCKAFRSTRVYLRELVDWIEANPEPEPDEDELPSKERLERLNLKEQWEGRKFKNAVERKEYIHRDDYEADAIKVADLFRTELLAFHADQVTWEGLPAVERDKRGKARVKQSMEALKRALRV